MVWTGLCLTYGSCLRLFPWKLRRRWGAADEGQVELTKKDQKKNGCHVNQPGEGPAYLYWVQMFLLAEWNGLRQEVFKLWRLCRQILGGNRCLKCLLNHFVWFLQSLHNVLNLFNCRIKDSSPWGIKICLQDIFCPPRNSITINVPFTTTTKKQTDFNSVSQQFCMWRTLRDEEKSRGSAGDGFYVFFVVAAVVANQQVVEDSHDAHQEQEEEDSFPKQVAGSAAAEIKKKKQTHIRWMQDIHARCCVFILTFERFVPCIQQSTSAALRDRWSQQRQQELRRDERNTESCVEPLCLSINIYGQNTFFWWRFVEEIWYGQFEHYYVNKFCRRRTFW